MSETQHGQLDSLTGLADVKFGLRDRIPPVQVVFPDSAIPPLLHSCKRMLRDGKTKFQPDLPPRIDATEPGTNGRHRCPCGSYVRVIDGIISGRWYDKNAARKNPNWDTRESAPKVAGVVYV